MVGFYMEFSTPGFGLPGTVAITCLFLLLLASFSLELAGWLEVILLFTGLAILLIEFFVLPTFGLLGFIGFIFFLMGLLGLMIPGIGQFQFDLDTKSVNAAGQVVLERLAWFSATFVISLGIISLLARYVMPNFSGFRKFVLEGHEQTGYTSADDPSSYPLAGASGIVVSTLRPSGKIDVDGKYYDAMSTGGFIEKGEKVEVLRIEGSQVIVNKDYREKT
jgi:membrane-bound ClpP family serine protease